MKPFGASPFFSLSLFVYFIFHFCLWCCYSWIGGGGGGGSGF